MTTAFNEDWQGPGDEMYIRPSQRPDPQVTRWIFEFKDDHAARCLECTNHSWRCGPGLVWSQVMGDSANAA